MRAIKKTISVILVTIIAVLTLTGCSVGFKFNLGSINLHEKKVIQSVASLKKSHPFKYKSIYGDFYDDKEKLLNEEDTYYFDSVGFTPLKSKADLCFSYFRGYKTIAYFYKFQEGVMPLTFKYESDMNSGKCKIVIVSPANEIAAEIPIEGSGEQTIDVAETGNYYVRIVGEEASGGVTVNAVGVSIVYKFTPNDFRNKIGVTGLYDYK